MCPCYLLSITPCDKLITMLPCKFQESNFIHFKRVVSANPLGCYSCFEKTPYQVSCSKRDTSHSMRGQCCSKLQVDKSSQTCCQSHHWIFLGRYQLIAFWKATKAQRWTSKPPRLALTQWVSRTTKMSRVRQWGEEYQSYSLWQMRSLASYQQILKQLLVVGNMDYHSLDNEVRHI